MRHHLLQRGVLCGDREEGVVARDVESGVAFMPLRPLRSPLVVGAELLHHVVVLSQVLRTPARVDASSRTSQKYSLSTISMSGKILPSDGDVIYLFTPAQSVETPLQAHSFVWASVPEVLPRILFFFSENDTTGPSWAMTR